MRLSCTLTVIILIIFSQYKVHRIVEMERQLFEILVPNKVHRCVILSLQKIIEHAKNEGKFTDRVW